MNTLFDIQSDVLHNEDMCLLMEVGADYCAYGITDRKKNSLASIKYLTFDAFSADDAIEKIVQEEQQKNITHSIVCSAFPESLLVPQKSFNGEYGLMDTIYDQPAQHYLHDRIAEWQMVNMYAIPSSIYCILSSLPAVKFYHAYTPCLKIYNGFAGEEQVTAHFNRQTFRVLVRKQGKVHLAQTYFYKTPLDVVYYLLKIFSELALDQKESYLILSGLVQQDSALYKELHSYFGNMHFTHPPMITLPPNDHPHHFFTSLYNLAACES